MWQLEAEPSPARLRALRVRWSAEGAILTQMLTETQAELECWQREAALLRLAGSPVNEAMLRRCTYLQEACDELATELLHVRLALIGATEEIERLMFPANDLLAQTVELCG